MEVVFPDTPCEIYLMEMRQPKSVLVTGGAGFIGSALVRFLLGPGGPDVRVITLDALTYAGNRANLVPVEGSSRHLFVHGDICDGELVARLCREHGVDTIVNIAAESHVDRSIAGPQSFVETNIVGVFTLLEVARASGGIHFHQVSTDEVFGSLGETGKFAETSPYDPRSPYSASKASADHLVRAYAHTYGISTTISNCSNNYGPYQFPEKLVPLVILNCLANEPVPVYGDGGNVRDWLYVEDHAEAIWLVVQEGRGGESYNVGGDCELRNIDLVHRLIEMVAAATGRDAGAGRDLVTFVRDRPGHDRRYAIDATKIRAALGWQPRFDIETGLRQTVDWYLSHRDWIAGVQSGAYREWIAENYRDR